MIDKQTWFEVWLLGYDKYGYSTDFDAFVDEFDTEEAAMKKAETIHSLEDVFSKEECEEIRKCGVVDKVCVVVEEVYTDPLGFITSVNSVELTVFSIL